MSALLTPAPVRLAPAGEAAARRALRAQIARLETDLAVQRSSTRRSATFAELIGGQGGPGGGAAAIARTAPRLLSLGELEAERDRLAEHLAGDRAALAAAADRQEGFRRLREEMLLDPAAHRYARVSNADVGEPGCLDWHVRPRFGVLGTFMRWWRVRISSGCP
jgi:hypothetical protein